MADKDYSQLDEPYNSYLERDTNQFGLTNETPNNSNVGASSVSDPSDIDGGSVDGQSFENLFIGSWIKSLNWQPKVRGFYIDGRTGYAEFSNILVTGTITASTLQYGKTSFTDSTNAGYFISSSGLYVGAAGDSTKLKYTVADGTFDFIGTISSRSTATIASAINSSGNLITDLINARLDSSSKKILSDFNFGTTNYAGGVKAGDITWNTTTGAITGGSGIVVYRGGIVGAASGATTFTIDSTTGNATFAGSLSAPTGTIGGFTIGASSLTASASGNTTTVSSGSTAFSAGPTGSPTFTVTQAGALTVTNGTITGGTIRTSSGTTRVEMDSGDNTLIAYVSGNQRAFFGGLAGAVSVLPGGASEVGGGMISTSNGQLTIFSGDPSSAITGTVRIEASNGATIASDDANIAALFLDVDQNNGSNAIGLKIDIQQAGAGSVYAFQFAGEEVDNSKTGVSGLTGVVKVVTSDGLVYIPLYDTAT